MLASNEERFTEERFTEEYDLSLDPLKAIRTPSRFDSGAGAGIKAIPTAGGEDADEFDRWFDSEAGDLFTLFDVDSDESNLSEELEGSCGNSGIYAMVPPDANSGAGRASDLDDSTSDTISPITGPPLSARPIPPSAEGSSGLTDLLQEHAAEFATQVLPTPVWRGLQTFPHQISDSCPAVEMKRKCCAIKRKRSFKLPRSGFYGVSKLHNKGMKVAKWRARINGCGKEMSIGTFATKQEAAAAYDTVAFCLLGSAAPLNFPTAKRKFDVFTEQHATSSAPVEDMSSTKQFQEKSLSAIFMEKEEMQKANVAKIAEADLAKPLPLLWHSTRKQAHLLQICRVAGMISPCLLQIEQHISDTDKHIIELDKHCQEEKLLD